MTDAALAYDPEIGAFDVRDPAEKAAGNDLRAAVVISLFSDAHAGADDTLPDNRDDRRGWWADSYTQPARIGSHLWLVARKKATQATRQRIERYARESLQWLIDDNVVSLVNVNAHITSRGRIELSIEITSGRGESSEEFLPQADNAQIKDLAGLDISLVIRSSRALRAAVNSFGEGP